MLDPPPGGRSWRFIGRIRADCEGFGSERGDAPLPAVDLGIEPPLLVEQPVGPRAGAGDGLGTPLGLLRAAHRLEAELVHLDERVLHIRLVDPAAPAAFVPTTDPGPGRGRKLGVVLGLGRAPHRVVTELVDLGERGIGIARDPIAAPFELLDRCCAASEPVVVRLRQRGVEVVDTARGPGGASQ